MKIILDAIAMTLALVWLVGFFGYKLAGTLLDFLPLMALGFVIARYFHGKIRDRENSKKLLKMTDYDAEH